MPTRCPPSLVSNTDQLSPSDNEALIFHLAKAVTMNTLPNVLQRDYPVQFIIQSLKYNTTDIRNEIHALYTKIYSEGSQWCLVTQSRLSLIVAHIVQRA